MWSDEQVYAYGIFALEFGVLESTFGKWMAYLGGNPKRKTLEAKIDFVRAKVVAKIDDPAGEFGKLCDDCQKMRTFRNDLLHNAAMSDVLNHPQPAPEKVKQTLKHLKLGELSAEELEAKAEDVDTLSQQVAEYVLLATGVMFDWRNRPQGD